MTIARAPGKLVLSGSYSVLWGAPALVASVDRFAVADSSREPVHVAEEVLAAVRLGLIERPCYVDASSLRVAEPGGTSRKLGLGSSAAILLATLVATRGDPPTDAARQALFADGLRAHREAQGGGSGIDVAASTFGGVMTFRRRDPVPEVTPHQLPDGIVIHVFACDAPAVTSSFVAQVRALAASHPPRFEAIIAQAGGGASACASAADARAFLSGLDTQRRALTELGDAAGIPIITPAMAALAAIAETEGGVFLPSGAGGGDIAFFAGLRQPSGSFIEEARNRSLTPLELRLGAPGASTSEGQR